VIEDSIVVHTRSIVVNHLQTLFKDNNVAIACIYCNYKEQTEQTASNLVASLLKQIMPDHFAISDNLKSLYNHHNDKCTSPTLDEFAKALKLEIGKYSKVFIVVDALDECREDDGTRTNLLRVLQSLAGMVNLMVTSRDLVSIAREFEETKRLNIRANNQDVQRYIEGRIARAPRRHLKVLQESIVRKMVENVRGM
jgi:hypothetical protein